MNMALIDNGGGFPQRSFAQAWYMRVGHETAHDGTAFAVGNIYMIGSSTQGMSLQSLLQQVVAEGLVASRIDRMLTVHHGTPDGMYIPLCPGCPMPSQGATQANLGLLSGRYHLASDGSAHPIRGLGGDQPPTDDELAAHWSMPADQVASLRRLMRQVRQMQIQHLDIRACNLGDSPPTLEEIGHFLGIPNVCAPNEYDVFGHVPFQIVSTSPSGSQWVPYVDQQRVIQVWIRRTGAIVTGRAPDQTSVEHFMASHFAAGNAYHPLPPHIQQATSPQGIEFHAFEIAQLNIAGSNYQNGLGFPGMPQYTNHLRHVAIQIPRG